MAACGSPCDNDEMKEMENENASVVPYEDFDEESDAKVLRKAMKGFGTDEDAIIDVVANRSSLQLVKVLQKYKSAFGRDLIKDLKKELGGKLEKVVIPRFYPQQQLTAYLCRDAMSGAGTDEFQLILALCTKNNEEIEATKAAYKALYDRDLEEDIKKECSGDFENLLVSVVQAKRESEEDDVDEDKAKEEAEALKEAGTDSWGTDEDTFNMILNLRSYEQLRATFKAYKKITGTEFTQAIDDEFGGDLKKGLMTIVKTIQDPIAMYAELLYKAMKGAGTDDDTLINVVLMRVEYDMERIKKAFAHFYTDEESMLKMMKEDTSGDYEKILLALCKGSANY